MFLHERIFFWNCHRAKSGEFLREIKEYGRSYKAAIIFLVELRLAESQQMKCVRNWGRIDGLGQTQMVLAVEYGVYEMRKRWRWI